MSGREENTRKAPAYRNFPAERRTFCLCNE
jgi:hypothetical protein